ncbi:MAG: RAD55 family ATPase [Candidatus Binatia bacterium]
MKKNRISTGIVGLDPLLEGGLPEGKSYLLTGDPGTGKTIICMQFVLKGLMEGENAIYITIDERPAEILEQAASLGWDLAPYVEKKQLLILDASAYFSSRMGGGKEKHTDIQKVVGDLNGYVKRMEAKRIVIDPVGPLILLRDSLSRIQDQTRILVHLLQSNMQTTNLLTTYSVPRIGETGPHGVEEYLVAGSMVLRMNRVNNHFVRTLVIEKMRSTAFELLQHEFSIVKGKGVVLQART